MRETVRKLSIIAGALCLMLAGVVFGGITGSAKTISVGSNWTTGHRNANDADLLHQYQFTVPKDGKVTVTCKSMETDWRIYLENADCTGYYNYAGGANNASFSEYVKAGTYGIFFKAGYYALDGDYQFKVEFTPVECDVPEPNNDFLSATPITLNQVKKGLLTDTNEDDYFKIDLKTATSLQISTAGTRKATHWPKSETVTMLRNIRILTVVIIQQKSIWQQEHIISESMDMHMKAVLTPSSAVPSSTSLVSIFVVR